MTVLYKDAEMPQRILIAEDDEIQGEVLRAALVSRGYEAEIVTDGLEAVRRICNQHYDLALLDYQLPEVDGLAAAQLLHDLVLEQDRPRLIAITALAPRLNEQQRLRGPSFDAIVSKQLGLPALLNVIDTNLASAAKINAANFIIHGQKTSEAEIVKRRCRWTALVGILPALVIVGVFIAAFALEVATLHNVVSASSSVLNTIVIGENTGNLVTTMQDVELSQKIYMATRTEAAFDAFEANVQHADQTLVASSPLSGDMSPGFDMELQAPAIVAPRLRVLTEQANLTRETGSVPESQEVAGRTVTQQLGIWAANVLSIPQKALIAGLASVSRDTEFILAMLGTGIVCGLGNAVMVVRKNWQKASSTAVVIPSRLLYRNNQRQNKGTRVSLP